jgi:hypothetical protein
MNSTLSELPLLLSRLLDCYRRLLAEESCRVDCYLNNDLESAAALRITEDRLLEEVRSLHERIREVTGERSLGDWLHDGDAQLEQAQSHVVALSRVVREVQQAVDRSRRFVFNSLVFSQALLGPLLGEEGGHYNGEGFLQTGRNAVGRRGVRA